MWKVSTVDVERRLRASLPRGVRNTSHFERVDARLDRGVRRCARLAPPAGCQTFCSISASLWQLSTSRSASPPEN